MRAESLLSPAGRLLYRHRTLVLALALLSAYAVAVPPSETFGSHHFEQIKDVLALAFVAIGLTLRLVASGLRLERRELHSPFYAANLLVLFGIFLMHGNFYVVALGALACVAIYRIVRQAEGAPAQMPWEAIFNGSERFRLGVAIAKEWPIVAASVCLLVLTESYEELGGGAVSLHHLIFGLSGVAVLIGAAALGVQLRREMALPIRLSRIRRRAASALGAALCLAGRLRASIPAPLPLAGDRRGPHRKEGKRHALVRDSFRHRGL